MIIYSLIMALPLYFHMVVQKNKKIILFILLALLFLVSAFRYGIGTDYFHYVDVYYTIQSGISSYVEPGYFFINIIIQKLGGNYYWIFIVSSLLLSISLWRGVTKCVDSNYWFYSVFLFITTGAYFSSMNLLRQYMAISIVILALPWFLNKKYVKFCMAVLLASLFHTTALVSFAIFLSPLINFKKKMSVLLWIVYGISLLFIVFDIRVVVQSFSFVVPEKYVGYLGSTFFLQKNYSAALKIIVPNLTLILLLIFKKRLLIKNPRNNVYIMGSYIYVLLMNLFFGVVTFTRLSEYFYFLYMIGIIRTIQLFNKKWDHFIIIGLYTTYFIILTIITIFIMGGHGVMPYRTIFSDLLE